MIETEKYFNMSVDELLQLFAHSEITVEEHKIFNAGKPVVIFDDIQEYEEEKEKFERWVATDYPDTSFKAMLRTVNGRIALIYE